MRSGIAALVALVLLCQMMTANAACSDPGGTCFMPDDMEKGYCAVYTAGTWVPIVPGSAMGYWWNGACRKAGMSYVECNGNTFPLSYYAPGAKIKCDFSGKTVIINNPVDVSGENGQSNYLDNLWCQADLNYYWTDVGSGYWLPNPPLTLIQWPITDRRNMGESGGLIAIKAKEIQFANYPLGNGALFANGGNGATTMLAEGAGGVPWLPGGNWYQGGGGAGGTIILQTESTEPISSEDMGLIDVNGGNGANAPTYVAGNSDHADGAKCHYYNSLGFAKGFAFGGKGFEQSLAGLGTGWISIPASICGDGAMGGFGGCSLSGCGGVAGGTGSTPGQGGQGGGTGMNNPAPVKIGGTGGGGGGAAGRIYFSFEPGTLPVPVIAYISGWGGWGGTGNGGSGGGGGLGGYGSLSPIKLMDTCSDLAGQDGQDGTMRGGGGGGGGAGGTYYVTSAGVPASASCSMVVTDQRTNPPDCSPPIAPATTPKDFKVDITFSKAVGQVLRYRCRNSESWKIPLISPPLLTTYCDYPTGMGIYEIQAEIYNSLLGYTVAPCTSETVTCGYGFCSLYA